MPKIVGGGRPFSPKICAESDPPPFRTQRFRPISAHGASTVIASDNVSISTNRKSTTRFSMSHRWTMYVTPSPLEGGWKREFLHFALPFTSSLQVVVDISNLVYGLNIASPNYREETVPEMGVSTSRDPFLANVNSRSRSPYAIAVPSVVSLSVCPSSVTFVHPTSAVEIFGNFASPFGTLAIHWHPRKILRRSCQGNPSVGGYKRKRGSQI